MAADRFWAFAERLHHHHGSVRFALEHPVVDEPDEVEPESDSDEDALVAHVRGAAPPNRFDGQELGRRMGRRDVYTVQSGADFA